nr:hypothetical protein [Embleya scabrispora]
MNAVASSCRCSRASGEGVGDEAAVFAGDGGGAGFAGGDPVDLVVGDGAVVELSEAGEEVFVGASGAVCCAGGDGGVGVVGDPGGEVEVVGGEVVDDADVGDAVWVGAGASGVDFEHVAEVAVFEAGAQGDEGGVEAFDVADGGGDVGVSEGVA